MTYFTHPRGAGVWLEHSGSLARECRVAIVALLAIVADRCFASFEVLEHFPITWNHVIEKESLKFKELEHVLIEKVEQLFRDML